MDAEGFNKSSTVVIPHRVDSDGSLLVNGTADDWSVQWTPVAVQRRSVYYRVMLHWDNLSTLQRVRSQTVPSSFHSSRQRTSKTVLDLGSTSDRPRYHYCQKCSTLLLPLTFGRAMPHASSRLRAAAWWRNNKNILLHPSVTIQP